MGACLLLWAMWGKAGPGDRRTLRGTQWRGKSLDSPFPAPRREIILELKEGGSCQLLWAKGGKLGLGIQQETDREAGERKQPGWPFSSSRAGDSGIIGGLLKEGSTTVGHTGESWAWGQQDPERDAGRGKSWNGPLPATGGRFQEVWEGSSTRKGSLLPFSSLPTEKCHFSPLASPFSSFPGPPESRADRSPLAAGRGWGRTARSKLGRPWR